jgi:hypothetical protein
MGEVRLDAAEVRALATRVLDGADVLYETRWPTLASDALTGSAVERAAVTSCLEDGVADVVGAMRTWAAAAQSAAAGLQQADQRQAGRLRRPQ